MKKTAKILITLIMVLTMAFVVAIPVFAVDFDYENTIQNSKTSFDTVEENIEENIEENSKETEAEKAKRERERREEETEKQIEEQMKEAKKIIITVFSIVGTFVLVGMIIIYFDTKKIGMSRLWMFVMLLHIIGIIWYLGARAMYMQTTPQTVNVITCPVCNAKHPYGTSVCSICGAKLGQ